MKGKKPAKNLGGRPVKREPEQGKRTHLSLAVPLALKRKLEKEALEHGWSLSNEAAHRLEQSFDWPTIVEMMFRNYVETWRALKEQQGDTAALERVFGKEPKK